jgi:hypothetical protein
MLLALILELFDQVFDLLFIFFNPIFHLCFQIIRFPEFILEPLCEHFPLLEFQIQIFNFSLVLVINMVSLLLQSLYFSLEGRTLLRFIHKRMFGGLNFLLEFAGFLNGQFKGFSLLLEDPI